VFSILSIQGEFFSTKTFEPSILNNGSAITGVESQKGVLIFAD
jgi:hypothetical protein